MKYRKTERRQDVLKRLEKQLKSGSKTNKKSTTKVPLTEKDVKRINKEIEILKERT